jgi:hypothetical protein
VHSTFISRVLLPVAAAVALKAVADAHGGLAGWLAAGAAGAAPALWWLKRLGCAEAAGAVLAAFLGGVLAVCGRHARDLFTPRHGRRHRAMGLIYLCLLAVGVHDLCVRTMAQATPATSTTTTAAETEEAWVLRVGRVAAWRFSYCAYDTALGVAGIALTLTAAYDFQPGHLKVHWKRCHARIGQ